eukprot:SAG31_NODE_1089_length_9972_cov_4.602856_11_plen_143_part_00
MARTSTLESAQFEAGVQQGQNFTFQVVPRDEYSNPVTDQTASFTLSKSATVYAGASDQTETISCGAHSSSGGYDCTFKYQELSADSYDIRVTLDGLLVGGAAKQVTVTLAGGVRMVYAPCEDLSGCVRCWYHWMFHGTAAAL